jgi:fructosamine-3-kinase
VHQSFYIGTILSFATGGTFSRILLSGSSASFSTRLSMSSTETYMDVLSKAASEALGRAVQLEPTNGAGASGGGGASTSAVVDPATGTRYFVKSARNSIEMLRAEYLGVKEMSNTNTIRVPTPIAFGEYKQGNRAFVIFEYLEFTGGGSQYELGKQLARMHRTTSPNAQFGFHVDNTIGATPQPNLPWMDNWEDFWDEHRLGHMLKLTGDAGLSKERVEALRKKTRELLSHEPAPSLIHGDLWGGNKGFCKENGETVPCIFDPATYYGDREADVAMTYVFGGFNSDFYKGYNDEWPLPDGHEQRRTVYNLYHILNHDVLFGGGYINQARGMIDKIMKS